MFFQLQVPYSRHFKFGEFRHYCAEAEIDPGKNKNVYKFYITCLRKCRDPEEVVIYPWRETV